MRCKIVLWVANSPCEAQYGGNPRFVTALPQLGATRLIAKKCTSTPDDATSTCIAARRPLIDALKSTDEVVFPARTCAVLGPLAVQGIPHMRKIVFAFAAAGAALALSACSEKAADEAAATASDAAATATDAAATATDAASGAADAAATGAADAASGAADAASGAADAAAGAASDAAAAAGEAAKKM